jgi:hypothetical protein
VTVVLTQVMSLIGRLVESLGGSTEMLIIMPVATVILTIAIVLGRATRIGVWIEDLAYRLGAPSSVHPRAIVTHGSTLDESSAPFGWGDEHEIGSMFRGVDECCVG